ncbi:hypothetical protein N7481_012458 [Penicillium waksmanii]|uniref:uncharacterized protein n=1 Tax=Penicillium waksmanii TaxID=69791 RepID=UPI0025486659|nr:uncharacterized protein N7481_012458 [Penicillium waksmanii]KAJ5965744.1 hypothetical protein N7481_012458 [Penicillium waksmanii]
MTDEGGPDSCDNCSNTAHNNRQDGVSTNESSFGNSARQPLRIPPSDISREQVMHQEALSLYASFLNQRDGYVTWIQANISMLSDDQPVAFSETERMLNTISRGLSILFLFPTHFNADKRPGACFGIRASRICQAIRKTINIIRESTSFDPNAGKLLHIISLQIGRLTLDGYGESDNNAIRFNNEANEFDNFLRSSVPHSEAPQTSECIIHQVWELMTRATSFCDCRQCYQGRISSDPRLMPGGKLPIDDCL